MNVGADALRMFVIPSDLGREGIATTMTTFAVSGRALTVDAPGTAVAKDGVPDDFANAPLKFCFRNVCAVASHIRGVQWVSMQSNSSESLRTVNTGARILSALDDLDYDGAFALF